MSLMMSNFKTRGNIATLYPFLNISIDMIVLQMTLVANVYLEIEVLMVYRYHKPCLITRCLGKSAVIRSAKEVWPSLAGGQKGRTFFRQDGLSDVREGQRSGLDEDPR